MRSTRWWGIRATTRRRASSAWREVPARQKGYATAESECQRLGSGSVPRPFVRVKMSDLEWLKVEAFTAKRVRNELPGGNMTWQTFHAVRNAIVRACAKFGSTGPMGEIKLSNHVRI